MFIDRKTALLMSAATLALSACATTDGRLDLSQPDPSWGEANRATMAAQVVDPSPEYATPIPPTSASNAVRAADAYRAGSVEEVEGISSTDRDGGGSN